MGGARKSQPRDKQGRFIAKPANDSSALAEFLVDSWKLPRSWRSHKTRQAIRHIEKDPERRRQRIQELHDQREIIETEIDELRTGPSGRFGSAAIDKMVKGSKRRDKRLGQLSSTMKALVTEIEHLEAVENRRGPIGMPAFGNAVWSRNAAMLVMGLAALIVVIVIAL